MRAVPLGTTIDVPDGGRRLPQGLGAPPDRRPARRRDARVLGAHRLGASSTPAAPRRASPRISPRSTARCPGRSSRGRVPLPPTPDTATTHRDRRAARGPRSARPRQQRRLSRLPRGDGARRPAMPAPRPSPRSPRSVRLEYLLAGGRRREPSTGAAWQVGDGADATAGPGAWSTEPAPTSPGAALGPVPSSPSTQTGAVDDADGVQRRSVFDGTGADPAPADVVVEDGRIVDVGSGLDGDEAVDARRPDAAARPVRLPRPRRARATSTVAARQHAVLVSASTRRQQNLGLTLRAGITSVRDAGGADLGDPAGARADGLIAGPRMQISIAMLSQTGGHGDDWLASGVDVPLIGAVPGLPVRHRRRARRDAAQGPRAAPRRRRRDQGRDVGRRAVAARRPAPRPLLARRARRPRRRGDGRRACSSWPTPRAPTGIKNAVRAGIRSIEHGIFLDDEAIELMLERGTWLVPTLVAPAGRHRRGRRRRAVPAGRPREGASRSSTSTGATFATAVAAGVRVAMGTDCGRDAARREPARARADADLRHGARRRPRGDDPERRPAAGRRRRARARSSRASSPTSWSCAAIRTTSRRCPTGSTASGSAAARSRPRPPSTFGP